MMPAINRTIILSLLEMAFFWGVIMNIILCYSIAYFLVPKYYQKKKYFLFTIGLIAFYALMQLIGSMHFFVMGTPLQSAIGSTAQKLIPMLRPGFIRLFGNPPLICGLFLSIKIVKGWHIEQLRSETLAKENANAELQLLKAQVHPHFLFNTLNNIYAFALTQSSQAGMLVQKLSNMLNYMINECEKPLVPLSKEIKLIKDYIGLEKVRYGNRLSMEVEIEGDYESKMIAPLLMIPFVENCFKHGPSIMRGQQWISLSMHLQGNQLDLKLCNSKPPDIKHAANKKGIGLANVQKRLQLLYPGKHILKTEPAADSYSVHLQLTLQQALETEPDFKPVISPKLTAYE
jgi:hypothetical protein